MRMSLRVRRLVIVGLRASGKSTLAIHLGEITGLPVMELDKVFWRLGLWPHRTRRINPPFLMPGHASALASSPAPQTVAKQASLLTEQNVSSHVTSPVGMCAAMTVEQNSGAAREGRIMGAL